jgi:hypothetical protein
VEEGVAIEGALPRFVESETLEPADVKGVASVGQAMQPTRVRVTEDTEDTRGILGYPEASIRDGRRAYHPDSAVSRCFGGRDPEQEQGII